MRRDAVVVLGVASLPIYVLLGRVVFGDLQGFLRALKYVLTPNLLSMFRGEWTEDRWESMKLGLWIALCVGWVVGLAAALDELGVLRP